MSSNDDEKLVTQKDLNQLKDELLANMVSKTEFHQQASLTVTKDELNAAVAKLATKEELHRVEARLTTLEDKIEKLTVDVRANTHEIVSLKVDFNQFKVEMNQFKDEMSEKTDRIITAIDGLAQTVVDMRSEMAAFFYQSQRQQTTLADHEKRITTLEAVTGVTAGS